MQYDVSSGQVSSGIILNTDSMYVYDGGTAESTTVNTGGIMTVLGGGGMQILLRSLPMDIWK